MSSSNQISRKRRPPPEVIVFDDPAKRSKKTKDSQRQQWREPDDEPRQTETERPKFNLHQARHDIQRFSIDGLHGGDKDAAMTRLLVKLGSKPPKKEYVNYKELQEKIKAKRKEKYDRDMGQGISAPKTTSSSSSSRKRPQGGGKQSLYKDGQVGRYVNGVQVLDKKTIENVKKSSKKGGRRGGFKK